MRTYPTDEYDFKELKKLNAEQWQIDLLKLNPKYVHWGCFEDYMSTTKEGWASRVIVKNWKELEFRLDDLNELVNFYFKVYRKNHTCEHCDGSDLNKETYQLSEDWYDFEKTGRRWDNKLTDVEVLALAKQGRLHNFVKDNFYFDDKLQKWCGWKEGENVVLDSEPKIPTAEEVNTISKQGGFGGHDAINRSICITARAKHLGIYGNCEHCEEGYIYDDEKAIVALQLWFLHPRKGCSRGVYIESIVEEDIPNVISYLKEARDRNNERFSKL